MKMMRRVALAALVLAASAVSAHAEQVDNPMYAAWANFRPGSYVTLTGTLELGSMAGEAATRMDQQIIYKLVDVKPDMVTVETTASVKNNGRWFNYPAQTIHISAKTEKGTDGVLSLDDGQTDVKRTLKDIQVIKESADVLGRRYDAIARDYVVELVQDNVPGKISMHSKGWYVASVPGGLVKVESIGIGTLQTTTKMQISDMRALTASTRPATRPGAASAPAAEAGASEAATAPAVDGGSAAPPR